MFNSVGVHLHRRSRHRFAIGKLNRSVNEILQIITVSDFNIDAFVAVGECGHIGRSKGARSINNTRNSGFVFRCVSFDMVSPAPRRGFLPLKSRRLSDSVPFYVPIGEEE